jgi:hypothetical protein
VGDRHFHDDADNIVRVVGFPAVADATPAGFTLQVLLPEVAGSNIDFNQLGWHVVWMGVEG